MIAAARELITFFSITTNTDGSLDPPVVHRLAAKLDWLDTEAALLDGTEKERTRKK